MTESMNTPPHDGTALVGQIFTIGELVEQIAGYERSLAFTRERLDRARLELVRRLEAEGARMVPHDRYDVTLTPGTPTLDLSRIRPLLENEALLAYGLDKVFAPEHLETITVPDRWSLRDLQKAARDLGGVVSHLVNEATMRGPSHLRITEKQDK